MAYEKVKIEYRPYGGTRWNKLPFLLAIIAAVLSAVVKFAVFGMTFLSLFLICAAAALFIYGVVCMLAVRIRAFRSVKLIIHIAFIVWLLSFIIVELLIVHGMKDDTNIEADCVILLGAGLRGDVPTLTLLGRLDRALEYLNEYPDTYIIVSGGKGPGETITEAEAMRRYLEASGISPSRIFKEDRSRNTNENLIFSLEVIRERLYKDGEAFKACIISSDFHLSRARFLAGKYEIDAVFVGSRMPILWNQAAFMLREYFSTINAVFIRQ